ncbi:MAG: tetratricopeptide repeat protein [Desulfovibrio sp.]
MRKYDGIIREFFEGQRGEFVVVSDDNFFYRTLKGMAQKMLAVREAEVAHYTDRRTALRKVKKKLEKGTKVVMFVERLLRERPTTDFIYNMKKLFPDMKILLLTNETSKDNLVYFHEIGVDSVIIKPVSMDDLVVKIAFSLKPQGNLSKMVDEAQSHLEKGEFSEVFRIADEILQLKADSPIALMLKGDAYLEQDDRDSAQVCYEKAHESSRLYLAPLKKLAGFYEGHDEEKYLKYLLKLDNLSPLNTERKVDIGSVFVERKDFQQAEGFFDDAINLATKEAMSFVGNVTRKIADSFQESAPNLAEKYLLKTLEARKDKFSRSDMETFNKLGIALRRQGKWQEAVDNYLRAITIVPDDEGLFYNLAMAYKEGKIYGKAGDALVKALGINKTFYAKSENITLNVGEIFYQNRSYDKAAIFFTHALKLNPSNKLADRRVQQCKTQVVKSRVL